MSSKYSLSKLQRSLPRPGSWTAFGVSALIVTACALAKPPLDALAGATLPPFITLYPAVVLSALIGGIRTGLLATAATVLIGWYFWLPAYGRFYLLDASILTVVLYAIISSFLAWVVGLARAVLDDAAANEAERANAATESVHRIKNLLAVVQAIARKIGTETTTLEEYQKTLQARLSALDVAQGVLVRRDWTNVGLREVVQGTLAPFLPNPRLVVMQGPEIIVPARFVSGLCMALYELCTNGLKYGALAPGGGQATLAWSAQGEVCVLEWREALTTSAALAERSGFGSMLIRTALARAPDTHVDYEIGAQSVVAVFKWQCATPES